MKLPSIVAALLGVVAVVGAACSEAGGATPTPAAPVASPAPAHSAAVAPTPGPRPRLVFFMNPNGMPCQMQDRILRGMSPELNGKVDVVYFRTTEPADLAEFDRYGIRALPSLVLTDATGRELRRAPPGIQPAEQIRQLVGG